MEIARLTRSEVDRFVEQLWIPAQRAFARHAPHTLKDDIRTDGIDYRTSILDDDSIVTFLARDDEFVGYVTGKLDEPPPIYEDGPSCRIDELFVRESNRRQGVGHQLLDRVETWARTHDCPRTTLVVATTNTDAISFYGDHGYDTTEQHMLKPLD